MAEYIPQEARDFLNQHSEMWQAYCSHAETFSQAMDSLPVVDEYVMSAMMADALGYVHESTHRARIYQQALDWHEQQGASEFEVDHWLNNLGYGIEHNQLRARLVRKIGQIAQDSIAIIQGFVAKIATMLNMSIQDWQVSFSASPSITITFG